MEQRSRGRPVDTLRRMIYGEMKRAGVTGGEELVMSKEEQKPYAPIGSKQQLILLIFFLHIVNISHNILFSYFKDRFEFIFIKFIMDFEDYSS